MRPHLNPNPCRNSTPSGVSRTAVAAISTVLATVAAPGPTDAQERVIDSGVYRFLQGEPPSELGRETFVRTETALETSTTVPILDLRFDYRSDYGPDGRLRRFTARGVRLSTDSLVTEYSAVTTGSALELRQVRGARDTTWSAEVTPDVVVASQTLATFADLVRMAARRDTVFQAWSPELNRVVEVSLTFAGDTASIQSLTLPITVHLDPAGRAASIEVPTQRLRGERATTETLPPLEGTQCSPPDYSAPPTAPFGAEEVRVPVTPPAGEPFELAGTLTLPKSGQPPFAAVVLITGSGGQNRDEELCPLVAGYRPFRQIAERLGSEGVAVLRVDDRGVAESGGNPKEATSADFADDVRAEVEWLRGRADIAADRIVLAGHSEGAMIAPMLAAEDPGIFGLILMAGTAQSGLEVLRYQMTYPIETAEGISPEQKARLAADAVRRLETDTAGWNPWLRFFMRYDPLPVAARITQPTLILQGALDRQVTADQAEMLAEAIRGGGNEEVEVEIYPGLNHLFLPSAMDGSPAEYLTLEDTDLPDYVLDRMVEWLEEQRRRAEDR